MRRSMITILIALAAVVGTLAMPAPVSAWEDCGTSYMVERGDTLGSIARQCSTSVAALRLANPNLGRYIYPGQTLWLPGAYLDGGDGADIYVVDRGDTLKALAARFGTSMDLLASTNGIRNYNLIYEGQRLLLPGTGSTPPSEPSPGAGTYVVQSGDTLRKIASRYGISTQDLIAVNPQIANPNLIYRGQVIYLPVTASLYTVQRGDTMKNIAIRHGTTLEGLVALNPDISNVNLIYPGQVIRLW